MFEFKMSVEAILMHFETSFACEIRLIVQNTEGIQLCNEPPQLKIEQLFQPFKSVLSLYTCKVIRLFILVNADGTLRNHVS